MPRNSKLSSSKNLRKRRRTIKRFTVIGLSLVVLALVFTLGSYVVKQIVNAMATDDPPVSDTTQSTTTTLPPTTTTTHPVLTVNAPLATPRLTLYDITHDTMLYGQDADVPCAPASLTKILTSIVGIENTVEDEPITVGNEIKLIDPQSSRANLEVGQKLTREMLIDAMMLPSGNDAAYTMAAHVGRKVLGKENATDIEAVLAFTELMNAKARELGAVNSHFVNPDGIHHASHYTTAADMAQIAKYAMTIPELCASMSKSKVSVTLLSGQTKTWSNSNPMINPSSPYYYQGAKGMKTGYTNEAGRCVIVVAERNGVELVAVVMGSTTNNGRWVDAASLLDQGFALEASIHK